MLFSLVSHAIRPHRLARGAGKWSAALLRTPAGESAECTTCYRSPPFARSASSDSGAVACFKGLSFGHAQNELLTEVDFSIHKGSKVTIMGQNGSGLFHTNIF
eukprot:scaffold127172_cov35-Attheya_sp.AAC.1